MRKNRIKHVIRYVITGVIGSLIIMLSAALLVKQETTRPITPEQPTNIADKQNTMCVSEPGTRAYDMNGLFICELEPNSLAEVVDIITIANEPFAVCNIIYDDMEALNVLVKKSDLNTPPDNSALESRNQQLNKRATRLNRYTEPNNSLSTPDNPHAAEYKAARETYREFLRKIKQLTAQRDSTTGDERTLYSDELRKLKGEDIRLANDLKTIRRKFDTWNDEHTKTSAGTETTTK